MSYDSHHSGYFFYNLALIIYLQATVTKIELSTHAPFCSQ